MALEKYHKKRSFKKTTEPQGKIDIVKGKNRFVVQEHHARNLHYDFRLELPEEWRSGSIVLKSWAVPKGVPTEVGIKHLAVATEDHPVEYIDFEGNIPEGNYGAGTVKIWDSGKFSKMKMEFERKKIKILEFTLSGKKLKGDYVMIKTNFSANRDSWLLFKK
ncbi:MAG TPA: DNA polymerase ligase N-terminal domain-containing protein [Patescibacteria group bacterium]|nr:DNA polymerase ligase N-terminal domain-containing protein [Patescibacteria group bacterium]